MRSSLGESLASIERLDRPLDQVTTSSLEALQAFALGTDRFNRGDALAARPLFERATTLDPNFAMAWWFLSSSYQNAGLGGRTEYLDKAFSLRDRLSERERLMIETVHYAQLTGEWDKAADSAALWARTYPRVALPHYILVGIDLFAGRFDDALRESLEAVRLEPRNEIIMAGLVGTYARLDRFDEAKAVAEKAVADKVDGPSVRLNLLRIAFIENDRAAIDRQTQWFAGRPDEYISVNARAVNALTRGQRRQAIELLQQAAGMAKRRGLPAGGSLLPVDNALLGNCPAAGSPVATNPLLIVLCGDAAYAVKFAEEVAERQLPSLTWNTLQLPMIRAAAALKRNNPDDAVEMLKPAAPHDVYSPQAVYIRGLAYLAARKGTEAANEFQKIVDHRGIHWQFQPVLPRETGPLRAMAFVGVARGAALAGDTPRARKAYQDFLTLWKDADPDIPILVDARKEYAALN
jgi:tetratricopeptide (TPR) repeat protein